MVNSFIEYLILLFGISNHRCQLLISYSFPGLVGLYGYTGTGLAILSARSKLFSLHGHCDWPCYSVPMETEGFLLSTRWFSVYIADTCVGKLLNYGKNDGLFYVFTSVSFFDSVKKGDSWKTLIDLIKNFELVAAGSQNSGQEANHSQYCHSWRPKIWPDCVCRNKYEL